LARPDLADAACLDGLAPGEREILQDASVMGRTFTTASLAALTGMTLAEVHPLLTSLIRKEVLSLPSIRCPC